MAIATINPTTGELIKTFAALTPGEIEQKLAFAQATFESYQWVPFPQRAAWMNTAAEILTAQRQDLGRLITLEMGKTLTSAIAEVEKCAWVCRYYAEHAATFLADVAVTTDAHQSYVKYQPLGAILAVMPWNFPFWQVFRFAAPALMAGNVGILKHASNVPQCALAIAEIFREAGFPEGAFQTLLVGADQVASLIADDRIKAATLTGSEPAGMSLAATAGHYLKKTVLELGGSDPLIVLPSADLETAVTAAVTARMLNNGQSCIAAKRLIVVGEIGDVFTQKLMAQLQALKVGDPLLPETDLGPLATPQILHELDQQVQQSVQQGARLLLGGQPLDRPGNFYPPTLLTDIPPGSLADLAEFFGPVALLFQVADLDQAIALANKTSFGLGASAWTTVPEERDLLINELVSGSVFINGLVKSDPRLPFGGIKRSGYGRELGSQGIQEFVNIKTIWIR
ncbi:succinate-semialdehyde dehydrogenase [Neosynechococcus sphagnicola sy1]|uniref:Succinate-semialdehyde dehydrogenase n=2 Tax=Neosynechococcus TaxID=1501143 RepID=A0A098TT96_9CYAN|nr:NAD-dependent succinate-semialdehyde dehydrogenase [Neosynechococcus sphagnicola]KGF74008.1 succinate-semialdehyde dehydrogenase [Neosynechococcus sphagnicola sy1]